MQASRVKPRWRRRKRPPLLFLLPGLLIALGVLLPLVYLLVRATGASGGWSYLVRERTLAVFGRTLLLVLSVSVGSILIALPAAWLTLRTDLPGRRVWLTLAVLPLVIPSYVGAFAYVSAFAPGGLLSARLPLSPPVYGFWGALVVLTLFNYPYLLLALRAGLQGLDPSVEEAARNLGRGPLGSFLAVTLPLLRPALAAGVVLIALYVLSDFGAVAMLRYDTFARAIYVQYQGSFNRANAALLSLALVVLMALVLLADTWLRGRRRVDRVGAGAARKAVPIHLGRWRFPALLFMGGLVGVALVAPLSVVLVWFWRGLASAQTFGFEWLAVRNAVTVSLGAALLSVLAAVPVAVLAERYPSRLSTLIERLAYLGYALPGIVVALALVFFGARYAPVLYQTHALLLFAYLVLFLPQAVANLRASLAQVNPHLEEAAHSLGRGTFGTLTAVTLPLLRAGLLTSVALVFLTTMKELPATLLLRPIGFDTLATNVWSHTTEAFFAQAAPYALVMVLASSLSGLFLLLQERVPE